MLDINYQIVSSVILGGALLSGLLFLVWGSVRLYHNRRAERGTDMMTLLFMIYGCGATSSFFSFALAFWLPLLPVIGVLVILGVLCIAWGEYTLRYATLHERKVEPLAPWKIFFGAYLLFLSPILASPLLPTCIPFKLISLCLVLIFVILLIGQFLLWRHWDMVRQKGHEPQFLAQVHESMSRDASTAEKEEGKDAERPMED